MKTDKMKLAKVLSILLLVSIIEQAGSIPYKLYFIDDQRACWFYKSNKTIECKDLAASSQHDILKYPLDKYIEIFGRPF